MKEKLKEFIPLTEAQRKNIWENGVFVLDANVLLNMCRYSKKSCDELIEIIKTHKDSLWLPYQVGMEFLNNRLGVIEGVKSGFNRLLESISKTEAILEEGLKLKEFKSDTAHNIEKLRDDIKRFRKNEESKIKIWKKEYDDSDKDAIFQEILVLYDGKVGDDYEEAKLEEIYKEGEKRYNENVPPGYDDLKTKKEKGNRYLYGDLIWWKQAIDYARDNKSDLVIVTDDKKDDWWYKVSGKIVSPRVELIREFSKETNGRSFLMYQTHQFMEMAKTYDGAKVSDSSIKEAEETGTLDYNQLMELYHIDPKPASPFLRSKYLAGKIGDPLDNSIFASSYLSNPHGIQGISGIRGPVDGKGIISDLDLSTGLGITGDEGSFRVSDFLAQHPEEIVTPYPNDIINKWLSDNLSKKY